jgi:glutaredoxin
MDAETARIKREMDFDVTLSQVKPGTRPFTDKRGVPFLLDYVLFIDPKDPDCIEAERYLHSKGIGLDTIDITDYEGELIFEPLPIDFSSVPVLYTRKDDWYIGVGLIKAAVTEGMI